MAEMSPDEFGRRTSEHYRECFAEHGATPLGVDWNGTASQEAHFEQLLKLLPADRVLDVNDLGCGYGALADFLDARRKLEQYRGYDVNADMIGAARERWAEPRFAFEVSDRPTHEADFGVASGIFTLRLGRTDGECLSALFQTLEALHATSRFGFAFNCLTSYSDRQKMRDDLYYPDPCAVFDHCKRHFARDVALLHDYGLYAFTILVRKVVPLP
jgi:SAM-dependent methyltransferase